MKLSQIKSILILTTLFAFTSNFAQKYSFDNYDWEAKPSEEKISEAHLKEKEVILDKQIKIEVVVEGAMAKQFRLHHEKIFINSNDAIERNNKIYISFGQNEKVLTNKARVLLKNGDIITLNPNDIKEEINEERGVKYKYFAVNGLALGAIIEKLYVIEEAPDLKGMTIKMQAERPIAKIDFELIYPNNLVFKTKSYNGLPEAIINNSVLEGKSVLKVSDTNVIALNDDEQYANWDIEVKSFRYKLDANTTSGAKNLYSFKDFSINVHARITADLNKKEKKAVDSFCKDIVKTEDLQEQIWNIENKIKTTIAYEKYIDSKEDLAAVIVSKQAADADILRLYKAVFNYFDIENAIVFTSSRYKVPFESDFESYENLDNFLLFFPKINKYLSPEFADFRIPLFPKTLGNNNGLFIKDKIFSGVKMPISEIAFIPIPGSDVSHDFMDITVDFTTDIAKPVVSSKISFGGYSGLNMQALKNYYSEEDYKKVLKEIASNYTMKAEFESVTAENDGIENIGKKSFTLNCKFNGKDLMQSAGDKFLFSAGEIIGKQMEMYQESKRLMAVEVDYPHAYTRKITFILPKGVAVKNLEKFKMEYKCLVNNQTEAAFVSDFKQNNQTIVVENSEYYNLTKYPLAVFDSYRAVINAAADFNKIVLILSK